MADPSSGEASRQVTLILSALSAGKPQASDELFTLVYSDLRRLAAARIARLAPGQTLQATALVHEAYMHLVGGADPGWQGRAHFFGTAARAMRNILADHLKAKGRLKRGGHCKRVGDNTAAEIASDEGPSDAELAVEEALQELGKEFPRKAEVVTLCFFGGLSLPEVAEVLQLSPRTVERDWHFARAWLNGRLAEFEAEA
ncbi:MAG: sigma-70 family RNA polymerase sigma factor [Planctomycetes bacterium]|nr:sigma-70 family RNA polymerase sigma factor [Planctomycetota bacterium]